MNRILFSFTALSLLINVPAFADKVIITGEPVVLQQQGQVYYVPDTYTSNGTYNYVTLGTDNSVCYTAPQPNLSALTAKTVTVSEKGTQVTWTCYNYNPNYFATQ